MTSGISLKSQIILVIGSSSLDRVGWGSQPSIDLTGPINPNYTQGARGNFSVSSSGSPKSEMSLLPTEETSVSELSGSESGTTEILSTKSSSVKPSITYLRNTYRSLHHEN